MPLAVAAAVAAARAEKQDKQEKLVDTDFEKPDETDLNDIPSDKVSALNVIEIEGLLFPGFGSMRALHGKQVFPVLPIK